MDALKSEDSVSEKGVRWKTDTKTSLSLLTPVERWNWCWYRWHTLIQLIRWRCWWQIKNSIVTLPGKVQPRCHHLLAKMSSNPRLTYNIVLDKSIIYKIYSVYLIYTLKSLVDYDMKNAGLWDAIDWQAKTLYCLVIFSESGKDAVIGSWQQLTSWEALPYMSMWQVIFILQPMGRQAVIHLTGLLEVFISESSILATVPDNSVRYQKVTVLENAYLFFSPQIYCD